MKKALSIMLVVLMTLGGAVTAFGAEKVQLPKDVAGTAHEEAVEALMKANVVSGYKDGSYRPNNTLTRAEACAFLVNYLKPAQDALDTNSASKFDDVRGWAVAYVNYAVEKGIVSGYKDGTFRPENKVNYQEMAAMTVNALGIAPETLEGSWPDNYVNKAKELGMYENISVSRANQDQANRGDVAEMIYSLMKNKEKDMKKAVAERLAKSQKLMADVKSMSMDVSMDMSMSAAEQTISDIKSKMAMDMILEPLCMYMSADMSAMGETEKVEYYYVVEDNELMMYMLMDGQWTKLSMGDAGLYLKNQNPLDSMEAYLQAYDNVRIEGKDVVNGKPAAKIYAELSADYIDQSASVLDEVFAALNQGDAQSEAEMKALMAHLMETMKGFGYEMWLDNESNQLVKIRMDMTGLMDSVIQETMKNAAAADPQAAEELKDVKINKCAMEMTVTNLNQVKEIKLPEAAKNAVEMINFTEESLSQ